MSDSDKLWGGRFSERTDAFVEQFNASVGFDARLAQHDIRGSIAHASMLAAVGVLSEEEKRQICDGLEAIAQQVERGEFVWSVALEDVHMNIEARLTQRLADEGLGDVGKKLHTGRSRNDQVATDVRLWLRDEIDAIDGQLADFQRGLLELAEREVETIMPGFTHLQVAQPISFGHHMMAWFEMLARDRERLADCRKRVNRCPLGAAALAGTTFPIARQMTADLLGFDGPTRNSLDSVSDRDFAIEFVGFAALLMTHLSRMAEEMILWSSAQFDFVELPDRYCTGSSIMPQKKNPDVPELVRGKTARVQGALTALLVLMKSQPLAYNKDNQEDKEPLFDSVDTVRASLRAFADMVPAMRVKSERTRAAALQGFSTATDLADYLVRKGLAFRDAHEMVGKAVRLGVETQRDLAELELAELTAICDRIGEDVFEVLSLEGSVASRDHLGGTAFSQVRAAIEVARAEL